MSNPFVWKKNNDCQVPLERESEESDKLILHKASEFDTPSVQYKAFNARENLRYSKKCFVCFQ